jgi:hypothetical protein
MAEKACIDDWIKYHSGSFTSVRTTREQG